MVRERTPRGASTGKAGFFPPESPESLVDFVETFFSPSGALSRAPHFSFRPSQQAMARWVAQSLQKGTPLLVEAGTGTGKTLAYLIPGICFALQKGCRMVVSTYTIALGEQLVKKDLPLASQALGIPIRFLLLRGRHHYLCPRRLEQALKQSAGFSQPAYRAELERIAHWARTTLTGCKEELDPPPMPAVWAKVSSHLSHCHPNVCRPSRCFYQAIRMKAAEADVLVVNHALFFSSLASSLSSVPRNKAAEPGILRRNDLWILDEAHTVETVAARQWGLEIAWQELEELLTNLGSAGKESLLSRFGLSRLRKQIRLVKDQLQTLFFTLAQATAPHGYPARITEPVGHWEDPVAGLYELASSLESALERSASSLDDEEAKEAKESLFLLATQLELWFQQKLSGYVYWVEGSSPSLKLCAVPLWVGSYLRESLFSEGRSTILTSATLTVSRRFEPIQVRLGAERARTVQLPSPFDYARQMRVYLASDLPEPKGTEDPAYEDAVACRILSICKAVEGGILILFTSHRMLRSVAQKLQPKLASLDFSLLIQSPETPSYQLQERFRTLPRPVLFGAQSFWQGVDFVGNILRAVIITRLPFPTPEEPLAQARMEECTRQGKNPFWEYLLPEALLRFQQGIGRLIRSPEDQGIVVILDPRILTRSYGRLFLDSLPECPKEILQGKELFPTNVSLKGSLPTGKAFDTPTLSSSSGPPIES